MTFKGYYELDLMTCERSSGPELKGGNPMSLRLLVLKFDIASYI